MTCSGNTYNGLCNQTIYIGIFFPEADMFNSFIKTVQLSSLPHNNFLLKFYLESFLGKNNISSETYFLSMKNCQHPLDHRKEREFQKKHLLQ